MGLDMYLNRYPKLGLHVHTMQAIESMWEWKSKGKEKEFSLKDWCGLDESELPVKEVLDICETFRHDSYYDWDVEKRYPNEYMHDNVAYWRKANQILGWLDRNVADGEIENCKDYRISSEILQNLIDTCNYVLDNSELVAGKVSNGQKYEDGKWVDVFVDGLVVKDTTACEEFLPSQKGFFFGNQDYNEWYLDDVRYTATICEKILKETDFSRYELWFYASW